MIITPQISNEYPKTELARITDEMIWFFFKVEPLYFSTFEDDDNLDNFLSEPTCIKEQVIADAEKAFVHVLDSKYNTVKFAQYPRGKDGLYDSGLTRYGYVIGEDITFTTNSQEIVGGQIFKSKFSDNQDMIFIEGDTVSLLKNSAKHIHNFYREP